MDLLYRGSIHEVSYVFFWKVSVHMCFWVFTCMHDMFGMAWHGMLWCGRVWYCMVWYGMVRYVMCAMFSCMICIYVCTFVCM